MSLQLKKILCPVDFSEPSALALARAVEMAEQTGAALYLYTVVRPMPTAMFGDGFQFAELQKLPDMSTTAAKERLEQLAEKYAGPVRERLTQNVGMGVPFVEIVRYAREVEADLIVMGSHGLTGIEHLLIGSVAERVVRKAPCSVLVVRDANRRFTMP